MMDPNAQIILVKALYRIGLSAVGVCLILMGWTPITAVIGSVIIFVALL